VLIRLSGLSNKHQPNSCYSCKFIRDTTQDCVNPLEVPFRHNVRRSRVGVSGNVVVWVSQKLRIKVNKVRRKHAQCQSSPQVFSIEVGIKINLVPLRINSLRVSRSILVQSSKVNQAQSSLQKRKLVVQTEEAILGGIIYTESTPEPTYDTSTDNR
jgi:hypothetical protein